MATSLEMISDTNIRKEFISIAYQWFHGIITGEEFDNKATEIFVNCYPNPAKDFVYIPLHNNNGNIKCELYDLSGRLIKKFNITSNITLFKIDVKDFEQGSYFYRLTDGHKLNITKPFTIIK